MIHFILGSILSGNESIGYQPIISSVTECIFFKLLPSDFAVKQYNSYPLPVTKRNCRQSMLRSPASSPNSLVIATLGLSPSSMCPPTPFNLPFCQRGRFFLIKQTALLSESKRKPTTYLFTPLFYHLCD